MTWIITAEHCYDADGDELAGMTERPIVTFDDECNLQQALQPGEYVRVEPSSEALEEEPQEQF